MKKLLTRIASFALALFVAAGVMGTKHRAR